MTAETARGKGTTADRPRGGLPQTVARGRRRSWTGLAAWLALGVWAGVAQAQLTPEDIAALRAQGAAKGWTFTVGENEATGRSLQELCGAVEPPDWRAGAIIDPCIPSRSLPAAWDWRAHNGVTPIRNQGSCGSCWAFGAIGAMECAIKIATGTSVDLSEQWLVSCTQAGSCYGGWHTEAFQYLRCNRGHDPCGQGGAVLEAAFPYVAWNAPCYCPYAHPYYLTSWAALSGNPPTVSQIKQAIYERGPVTVSCYVNSPFHAYTGGVFNECEDPGYSNHSVVLVGWESNYWIMRNSWGPGWGEGGYMRIQYNCCRIGSDAAYVNYSVADCNYNGIPDECDIDAGLEPDCNHNGYPDECELAAGTGHDCTGNGIPDDCEADCNHNGFRDDCDLAAGTSQDCTANGIPDECETDCNHNGFRDDCDIAAGTSHDCTGNGVPDECESDCNANGIRDDCDIAAGTSRDCNLNGVPDPCDVQQCHELWNGFQELAYQTPMAGLDLDGDGVFWENPADSAKVWVYGCEFAGPSDRSVQVTVVTDPPEEGYVTSEYFQSDGGVLPPEDQIYELSFQLRLEGYLNPKTDWQLFLYDGQSGRAVLEIELPSTGSTRVPADQRGRVLVRNPAGAPAFLNTGVAVAVGTCYAFQVVLDNLAGTVQLSIDGAARLSPPATVLEEGARRMDDFRAQAVSNEMSSCGNTALKLDAFALCTTGRLAPPAQWDCNGNGVLDACDLADGTSQDNNADGVPDECEPQTNLLAAVPEDQASLGRSANNTIRLTFDGDITAPGLSQVEIRSLLPDGVFGPDLSTNGFTFTMETIDVGGVQRPRVLEIRENNTVLTHRTWIGVRNTGGWAGVAPFEVEYVVQVGDVNGDGKVLANDLSAIFPKIPTNPAGDQERADVNGDGQVLANDLSAVFPRIPSAPVPKPSRH